ncbi:hypothetical protein [Marinicauda pacifica]|uniref:hypothetical protein n=1 Tax=Marinicauda pacifica TaxID=1133559 RepID=UPI0035C85EB6
MSYIDSYPHELVGYFGPVPVYRPLEDIPGFVTETGWDGDFACRTDQIVIGGGSGERPGTVLERPAAAMACFALEHDGFDLPDSLRAAYQAEAGKAPIARHYGFDAEEHAAFAALIRSDGLLNPFYDGPDLTPETWLACSLGEFVYAAMPDLAPDRAAELARFERDRVHTRYNNILLPPPGLPVYANGGTAFEAVRRRR